MDRRRRTPWACWAPSSNALALQDALEHSGQPTRVLTAVAMPEAASPISAAGHRHLEKNRIVVFAAGMGNPYFTTDTSAALPSGRDRGRAALQGHPRRRRRRVLADPKVDPDATRFEEITFMEVVNKDLRVMDLTAITFCKDNGLPIQVFDLMKPKSEKEPSRASRSVRLSDERF